MSVRAAAVPAPEPPSTRDAILDAAERCFAERGFAGVSTREIAAEAGLRNQASLYHHFTDKRALYEAALARGVAPIVALMEESAGGWRAAAGRPRRGRRGPGGRRGRVRVRAAARARGRGGAAGGGGGRWGVAGIARPSPGGAAAAPRPGGVRVKRGGAPRVEVVGF